MARLERTWLYSKRLILSLLIHTGLMWLALVGSYNSFKEYIRKVNGTIPIEMKVNIKDVFPATIITFVTVFFIYSIWRIRSTNYPSFRHYIVFLIIQVSIINIMFLSKDIPILVVQNIAILYFVILLFLWTIFLFLWNGIKRLLKFDIVDVSKGFMPPIVYTLLQTKMPIVQTYLNEKPSRPYTVSFVCLLALCAVLLVFKQYRIVEYLEDVAYFLLLIGVYKELRYLSKSAYIDKKEKVDSVN